MNEKQQLIEEIERASEGLVREIPEVGEDADFERKIDMGRDIDL